MNSNYKILLAEDVPSDAELAEREILKILPNSEFLRVETRADFIQALDCFIPDIIVSDFQMPTFDGLSALKITLEKVPLTPFIIFTGSLNEDTAVDCMKAGATDYVIKDDVKRLAPAIKRALEIKAIKLENLAAQEALVESENRFRRLAENANDLIYRIEFLPTRRFVYVSPSSVAITGYTPEEHYNNPNLGMQIVHPDDHHLMEEMAVNPANIKNKLTCRWVHKNGRVIWAEQINVPIFNDLGELFAVESIARDITERKLAEEAIKRNELRLRSLVEILQTPTNSIEDYLDQSLNEALKLSASKFGYIYTYDETTQNFNLNSWSKDVMAECAIADPKKCYELNTTGLWGEAVRQRKPIVVNDFSAANSLKKGYPEGQVSLKNFLTIPVFIDEKIVAGIGVANKASDYDESDILQLTLLMNSAWKALEKKKDEHKIQILSTATEQSPVSVIITDTKGAIQYVNEKFIQSTRYSGKELHGRILRVFRSDYRSPQEYNDIFEHMQAGKPYKGELKNVKEDGEEFWESVNVSPIRDAQGIVTNYVILSEDITHRKRMEVDLIAAKEKAEENDRLKTAFLNNLSHEIRTPLNAVVGYAQMLTINDPSPDKIRAYSEIIQQGSHQLLSIMDNIITMAIIETGQVKINKKKCNLNKLLNAVYNQLKFKAELKKIKLESSALFSRYESEVEIDETKVVQVLSNLVENAIKYTDFGFVKFGCSVTGTEIQFFVEDSGRGIPIELTDVIFERFRQGIDHSERVEEGLGLGLSISKSYVEFMGGELKLESKVNHGSKFTFSVPYKAVVADAVSHSNSTNLNLSSRKTILIVDDVKINFFLVEEILREQDVALIYSSNGPNAIEVVAGNAPLDLVLMDIKMPGMDGYTATREIKKIKPELPVIAQTAYALAGDRQKSVENGCSDYITKPITRQSLFELLKRFLEK